MRTSPRKETLDEINAKSKDGITFAERLVKAREDRGLNKAELARLIGCTRAALSKWERGETGDVSAVTLARIADQLGVDMRTLLDGGASRIEADLDAMKEAIVAVEKYFPDRNAEEKAAFATRFYDWIQAGRELDEKTIAILSRIK
ncbi:MAG: helix-turn-helix transcriptional regulator [Gammaproteobacteria bacterium]